MTRPAKGKAPKVTRQMRESCDREAERTILGGMLLDPSLVADVGHVLIAEDFGIPQHQNLYTLIRALSDQGVVDVEGIASAVIERGAETYGGVSYVCGLPSACVSVEGVMLQVGHVRRLSLRREVLAHGLAVVAAAQGELDIDAVLRTVDTGAAGLRRPEAHGGTGWRSMATLTSTFVDDIDARRASGTGLSGHTTGLVDLDKRTKGLRRGELFIIGARPSAGKTALAGCIARTLAVAGVPVAFFELEMPATDLRDRLIANEAGVDYGAITVGDVSGDDLRRLSDAAERMAAWPLHIDDSPNVGVDQIRMRVRMLKQREPDLGLVVVDYVQLCRVDVPPGENRATAMGQVSRGLKLLAREQDVCVIALSQVNRACEGREDKRPTMGDLRESGNLEQDADLVAMLYRDEVYNEHSVEKGVAEIIVAKNRKGTTGKVRTAWLGHYQRFASLQGYEPPPPLREVPKRGHNGKSKGHYTEHDEDDGAPRW